ncbi:MAG TPA: hypothetical protein VLT61_12850 [Anaeromyxobacteraceae bacterium]|nr:hypothetical protein [Anaeromyxobacteraceae bacterium]
MADAGPHRSSEEEGALRAEHDVLAEQLRTRRSVDEWRLAAYTGFASALSFGLTVKFAWDRWGWSKLPKPPPRGRYPILVILACVLFAVLLWVTTRAVARARVHRAREERLIARFEELRRTLRLDA